MSTSRGIFDLLDSPEIDDKYEELKSLIDLDRSVLQSTVNNNGNRKFPIHVACSNPHVTLRIIKLLLNGWPESISHQNQLGDFPIHYLCRNDDLDEAVLVQILALFVKEHPESVHREDSEGELPIHMAATLGMSPKVLKILVDAYPESVGIHHGEYRILPIHSVCESDNCRLDSVKYLLDIYPESINTEDSEGWLPIHSAAYSCDPIIIEYLMLKDPDCASKVSNRGEYPLHVACRFANLAVMKLLFDAYPEAIVKTNDEGNTPLERAPRDVTDVIAFLEAQLVYAEKAKDTNALTTLDQNGWLPLHHALKNNAPLGSIKLLVNGCTLAVRVPDYNMAFPLHIACEFSSFKVVQYLMETMESDERMRNHLDVNKDSILHYACRGGNCEVVKYLLDEQSPHVTKCNADKKLPIHLLCESGASTDSLEQTDTIYRLLLAYPETVIEYM